jgi:hypothetical protein
MKISTERFTELAGKEVEKARIQPSLKLVPHFLYQKREVWQPFRTPRPRMPAGRRSVQKRSLDFRNFWRNLRKMQRPTGQRFFGPAVQKRPMIIS